MSPVSSNSSSYQGPSGSSYPPPQPPPTPHSVYSSTSSFSPTSTKSPTTPVGSAMTPLENYAEEFGFFDDSCYRPDRPWNGGPARAVYGGEYSKVEPDNLCVPSGLFSPLSGDISTIDTLDTDIVESPIGEPLSPKGTATTRQNWASGAADGTASTSLGRVDSTLVHLLNETPSEQLENARSVTARTKCAVHSKREREDDDDWEEGEIRDAEEQDEDIVKNKRPRTEPPCALPPPEPQSDNQTLSLTDFPIFCFATLASVSCLRVSSTGTDPSTHIEIKRGATPHGRFTIGKGGSQPSLDLVDAPPRWQALTGVNPDRHVQTTMTSPKKWSSVCSPVLPLVAGRAENAESREQAEQACVADAILRSSLLGRIPKLASERETPIPMRYEIPRPEKMRQLHEIEYLTYRHPPQWRAAMAPGVNLKHRFKYHVTVKRGRIFLPFEIQSPVQYPVVDLLDTALPLTGLGKGPPGTTMITDSGIFVLTDDKRGLLEKGMRVLFPKAKHPAEDDFPLLISTPDGKCLRLHPEDDKLFKQELLLIQQSILAIRDRLTSIHLATRIGPEIGLSVRSLHLSTISFGRFDGALRAQNSLWEFVGDVIWEQYTSLEYFGYGIRCGRVDDLPSRSLLQKGNIFMRDQLLRLGLAHFIHPSDLKTFSEYVELDGKPIANGFEILQCLTLRDSNGSWDKIDLLNRTRLAKGRLPPTTGSFKADVYPPDIVDILNRSGPAEPWATPGVLRSVLGRDFETPENLLLAKPGVLDPIRLEQLRDIGVANFKLAVLASIEAQFVNEYNNLSSGDMHIVCDKAFTNSVMLGEFLVDSGRKDRFAPGLADGDLASIMDRFYEIGGCAVLDTVKSPEVAMEGVGASFVNWLDRNGVLRHLHRIWQGRRRG